ncbi:hypothetical protein CP532_5661 [Ophiocordyceps camponoti-leonardi (nom. inval.)]|nr:hypothetical protein CP532_5661 [Ophiocordyceps camponoti-leonardi (nom. inval.)]
MADAGLGNASMLNKIDKLRELNVGAIVPLPQLVVVGDQSSGKSSVLESLTGFSFPRDVGLCTRYATQITCARDSFQSVSISIIPRPDADEKLKSELSAFHRELHELSSENLDKANVAMGIRMATTEESMEPPKGFADDDEIAVSAFSQDILKIEIHGPEQNHLTVIDVPGIFRNSTPGLTTEEDITLVRNMVQSYMKDRRTIILAVIPCNVDIATQEILKLAAAADPDGVRTMGVLTKPDLATEAATRKAVIDLVQGKRKTLKLGYYVVKNRGADDTTSDLAKRTEKETAFFTAPPWTTISERCGIAALKDRLRHLLMSLSRKELPQVKAEIEDSLRQCRAALGSMGPCRGNEVTQRQFLGKLANRFQEIALAALDAQYAREDIFKSDPELRLITRIIKLNEVFAEVFLKKGHLHSFDGSCDPFSLWLLKDTNGPDVKNLPLTKYCELGGIISQQEYACPNPSKEAIMTCIKEVYHGSRGPELGTFGGTILTAVFQSQSLKWDSLALSHTSKAIVLVHDFISRLLVHLCPEEQVRDQLWDNFLVQELKQRYEKAMGTARYLLKIERARRPSTFDHYFEESLKEKRTGHLSKQIQDMCSYQKSSGQYMVEKEACLQVIKKKSNDELVYEDILDTLKTYYKIARQRFVDNMCLQVISDCLLDGEDSPMKVFSSEFVLGLDAGQLEMIAGEDEETKEQRQTLERRARSLEEALKTKPSKKTQTAHSKKQASKISKSNNSKKKKTKTAAAGEKAHRKFTAGLTARTESLLGERVGHLEILGKGRGGGAGAGAAKGGSGGSRKFG